MSKHIWWQAPALTAVFLIISWLLYVLGAVVVRFTQTASEEKSVFAFMFNYWPLMILATMLFVVILIRVALEKHTTLFGLVKKKPWKFLLIVLGFNIGFFLFISLIPYGMSWFQGVPSNPNHPVYFENSCSDYTECVIIHRENGCCECQYGAYHESVVELRQKWSEIWYRHKCTGAQCLGVLCPDLTSRTVDCVDGKCEIFYAGSN